MLNFGLFFFLYFFKFPSGFLFCYFVEGETKEAFCSDKRTLLFLQRFLHTLCILKTKRKPAKQNTEKCFPIHLKLTCQKLGKSEKKEITAQTRYAPGPPIISLFYNLINLTTLLSQPNSACAKQ